MYKFERLLFRVKVAPGIFQQIMDTMLSRLDFAVAYLDDILTYHDNIEQHKKKHEKKKDEKKKEESKIMDLN